MGKNNNNAIIYVFVGFSFKSVVNATVCLAVTYLNAILQNVYFSVRRMNMGVLSRSGPTPSDASSTGMRLHPIKITFIQ